MTDSQHDDARDPLHQEDVFSRPQPNDPGVTGGIEDGGGAVDLGPVKNGPFGSPALPRVEPECTHAELVVRSAGAVTAVGW